MNNKNAPMIQFIGVDPNDFAKDIVFRLSKYMEKSHRARESQKEEFLTPKEAAKILKLNERTISRYSKGEEKLFTPRKIGNKTRYKRSDIEAVLNGEPTLKKRAKS